MTRLRVALLLLAATCLLALTARAGDKPGTKLKGWGEVIDPDRDCRVALDQGKLTVQTPGKAHDFAAELQRWNAPRIMGDVRGDFIAEVKVSGKFDPSMTSTIEGRRPYNGAGLLLVKDDKNHVSLHRGAVYLNNAVRQYLNFELRKDGELVTSRYEVDLEDQDTVLRLERRGSKVFALASTDGLHWKCYDDPIEVDFPEALKLGVEAVNSSDQPFRCALEGFAVFQRADGK
jgi:regulation of enolase protein 1 (concanavalin A-like superfamily)